MIVGGIEAGGTKWNCAVADGDGNVVAKDRFPTTTPHETLARAAAFFQDNGRPAVLAVGSFGPVDLNPASPTHGSITTTPKPGWAHTDVVSPLHEALGVPVVFENDVNVAAVGEWRRGAAVGLETFAYITVGTGIGAGVVANGRLLHGLVHPELGHMRVPHDWSRDPFPGACPRHGDCLEGLASGPAMQQRWGRPGAELTEDEPWALEAEYLAHGIANLVLTLSPQRVIVGGGVAQQPSLLGRVRTRLLEVVAGYLPVPELTTAAGVEGYVVAPALGGDAGIVGAIELALDAARDGRSGGLAPAGSP
jgi:fructokinase